MAKLKRVLICLLALVMLVVPIGSVYAEAATAVVVLLGVTAVVASALVAMGVIPSDDMTKFNALVTDTVSGLVAAGAAADMRVKGYILGGVAYVEQSVLNMIKQLAWQLGAFLAQDTVKTTTIAGIGTFPVYASIGAAFEAASDVPFSRASCADMPDSFSSGGITFNISSRNPSWASYIASPGGFSISMYPSSQNKKIGDLVFSTGGSVLYFFPLYNTRNGYQVLYRWDVGQVVVDEQLGGWTLENTPSAADNNISDDYGTWADAGVQVDAKTGALVGVDEGVLALPVSVPKEVADVGALTQTGAQTGTIAKDVAKEATDTAEKEAVGVDAKEAAKDAVENLTVGEIVFSKFPFCIPWDVYHGLQTLAQPGVAPVITIPLKSEHYGIDWTFDMDWSMFGDVLVIVRWGEYLVFCLSLAVATKKIVWG